MQHRDRVSRLSYGDLADRAGRVAAWLRAAGVPPGARVAILAENDDHWCAVYLGILRAAAIAVPLDTAYGPDQVASVFADSGACVAFVSPKYVAAARSAEPSVARLVMIRGHADGATSMEEVLGTAPGGPFPDSAPFDPAVLGAKGSLFLTRPGLNQYIATREELVGRAQDLFAWLAAGQLEITIERVFRLAEAADAHRALESRRTAGKLLLVP